MPAHPQLGFDDRWHMTLGIPLVAAVTALIFAQVEFAEPFSAPALMICFALGLFYTGTYWGLIRFALIRLRGVAQLDEHIGLRLTVIVGTVIGIVLAVKLVLAGASEVTGITSPSSNAERESSVVFDVLLSTVLCLMVVAFYESLYFFAKYRDGLVAQEQLAKRQMQAQFASLREQVNPHFLFNSLNTLATLIPEDPTQATRFVQRLSAVYRRVLEHNDDGLVTLDEELRALDDYLFLLRARFEDKLRVDIRVDAAARRCHVLPMAVQLLVENAVKHNVASAAQPLTVHITATDTHLTVANARQPRRRPPDSTGIGLRNLRERYRLLGAGDVLTEDTPAAFRVSLPLLSGTSTPQGAPTAHHTEVVKRAFAPHPQTLHSSLSPRAAV